ncbi:MAG: HAD family hydrolase [Suilimivivens sp.]
MKQRKYKAIIFDLDGTLLNTLEDLKDSVNYGLRKYGMPERTLEEIRHFVGNGVQKLVERAVPEETSKDDLEAVFAAFKEYYAVHCNDKTRPYSGISELLAEMKKRGYQMAIVSNKLQSGVDALKELYFKDYITVAIGGKEDMPKKPAPDMVIEALRQLGTEKENAVFVGDSEVDIATAVNAKMDCITVAWGFRTRQEQEEAGATVFANNPMEIMELL